MLCIISLLTDNPFFFYSLSQLNYTALTDTLYTSFIYLRVLTYNLYVHCTHTHTQTCIYLQIDLYIVIFFLVN